MRSLVRLAPFALLALPFFACSSNKNYDERKEAAKADPDYAPPFDESKYIGAADYEPAAKAACIGACTPDPGSKPIDVAAAQAGYDFVWMWDLAGEGFATATYTYDDNTPDFVTPYRQPATMNFGRGGWQPTPDPVPWQPGPALAVRFKGGPFSEYGGGFGQSFLTQSNIGERATLAPLKDSVNKVYSGFPLGGAYDLSAWEGIAIWVRRGPDGQATMRLGITEKHSAEDLNSGAMRDVATPGVDEGTYCKRWRYCGCSGETPCSPIMINGTQEEHCFDPAVHTPTAEEMSHLDFNIAYPYCGKFRCNQFNTSSNTTDPLFKDRECAYAITSDGHSDQYCYNPGMDPNPPAKRERCNNPFSRAFLVTTDWQLVKVPFSELRQADEAQVADDMDLTSVKQIVATFTGGWIDYWVANIGFYKKQ